MGSPSLRRRFQSRVLRVLWRAKQALSYYIVARLKRCRFQFSLRTLLIGVTVSAVVCGYVTRQLRIAADQKAAQQAALKWVYQNGGHAVSSQSEYLYIALAPDTPDEKVDEIRGAFPEVTVIRFIRPPD
jgi:hypothetical protein